MRVYEVGKESNSADSAGLTMWDEFLPYVRLDVDKFEKENSSLDEPRLGEDVKPFSDILNILTDEQKKVYTIVTDEDETIIPLVIEKGSDKNIDEDGIIQISTDKKVEGIKFDQESFETSVGKSIILKVIKTDPTFEDEIELRLVANDDSGTLIEEGELEDVLCGRVIVKFIKRKPKYETLKIKVLDCRSNEIVTNARVNKIVLNGAYELTTDFNSQSFNKKLGKADSSNKIKQSQQALDGLGFNTNIPGIAYGNAGRKAYNDYWQSRFPDLVEKNVIEKVTEGNPTEEMLDHIIKEYNSNFSTDEEGFINLQIPKDLLNAATTLEIGLRDFPILLEATQTSESNSENQVLRVNDNTGGGTDYQIRWGNGTENSPNDVTQDTEWNGNFGWHMKKDDRITEFKVSLQIPIKEGNDKFKEFDKELMSVFYENKNSPYHLVMYAMQWSQPVWDGIDDNPSGEVGAISDSSYIQHSDYHGMNMHLATRYSDIGGSDLNGGKGYGMMEACQAGWPTKYRSSIGGGYPGHSGFDLNLPIGYPIFAFRGGKAKSFTSDTHYMESITWEKVLSTAWNSIKYLHLSETGRIDGHVLSGTIIGKAGRSGNLGWTSDWPGHTHVNVGSYPNGTNNAKHYTSRLFETNKSIVDKWNLKIFPTNDFPLLLPCKCQIGNISQTGMFFSCSFDSKYSKQCWAAMELKCPSLLEKSNSPNENQRIRVIQAQLKYLGYYVGSNALLDNNKGTALNDAIIKYKTNNIDGLPIANSNSPVVNIQRKESFDNNNDVNNEITELLCSWLNNETNF